MTTPTEAKIIQDESDEEEERMRIDSLPVVEQFMHYFDQGIKVSIGLCERHQAIIVTILQTFVIAHQEFAPLIQPILDYDPEYASAGSIHFTRLPNGRVKSELILSPVYTTQPEQRIYGEWTREQLQRFAELTEIFGCFSVDGQDEGLNY